MNNHTVAAGIALKNILYATDFSPVAEAAAPYAVELARHYGAKVTAVHVRSPLGYGLSPAEAWPALTEAYQREAKEMGERLESLFGGVEHTLVIGEGDTWGVISGLIEENKIDLIVMGTHARKGIERLVLGSVAEKILRRSPVPVLTISPHVQVKPETEMKHILFVTDFSPESEKAAPFAIMLAEENQATLDMLHVIETPKSDEFVRAHDLVNATMNRLRQIITPDEALWCEPNFLVEEGDAAKRILEVASQRGADLIVMGVKAAAGDLGAATHAPWPIAHRVLINARCPVLTIRS